MWNAILPPTGIVPAAAVAANILPRKTRPTLRRRQVKLVCDPWLAGRRNACSQRSHLAEDKEGESRATEAEEGALGGTTKALQPAADSAMQAINPSFMAAQNVFLAVSRQAQGGRGPAGKIWGSVSRIHRFLACCFSRFPASAVRALASAPWLGSVVLLLCIAVEVPRGTQLRQV